MDYSADLPIQKIKLTEKAVMQEKAQNTLYRIKLNKENKTLYLCIDKQNSYYFNSDINRAYLFSNLPSHEEIIKYMNFGLEGLDSYEELSNPKHWEGTDISEKKRTPCYVFTYKNRVLLETGELLKQGNSIDQKLFTEKPSLDELYSCLCDFYNFDIDLSMTELIKEKVIVNIISDELFEEPILSNKPDTGNQSYQHLFPEEIRY